MPVLDTRAVLQVKSCINKILRNKNSINKLIAKTIVEFSHTSVLRKGSILECWPRMNFYMVSNLLSPFWVEVRHMPPRVDWIDVQQGLWYTPNFALAGPRHRKKIFEPFSNHPYIKKRTKHYMLRFKTRSEVRPVFLAL